MKTLITNLRGKCLFEVTMRTRVEGLINLYTRKNEEITLDEFFKGGKIRIEMDDPLEAAIKISDIIKGAKKHGKVFVAYDGIELGPLLGYVANKERVHAIFTCYKDQAVRLPVLKLELSKTRKKILESLSEENLTASELGKRIGISRSMVYKHINELNELGLVKQSPLFRKYTITKSGKLAIF